ncbi:MAG: hypothetical protein BGO65_09440 [Afipia sp. 64-13]|nr:MAG: hypothetical protein BGO65_09440 [Afipia sp. 64-13]
MQDLTENPCFDEPASGLCSKKTPDHGMTSFMDTSAMECLIRLDDLMGKSVFQVGKPHRSAFISRLPPGISNDLFDHRPRSPSEPNGDIFHILRGKLPSEMMAKNANPGLRIGQGDSDMFPQSTRSKDGLVDLARQIAGTDDNDPLTPLDAVESFQKRVDHFAAILLVFSIKRLAISE